jgi:FkbM family methyltransferase
MLYILDLGANDGCSIRKFKTEYLNNITDYKIYSFEPHPFFKKYLLNEVNNDDNIIYIDKAISTKNIKTSFYYSIRNDGSTLNNTKISNGINIKNKFNVDCIDIVEFINNINLKKTDQLWIKMDIEGEEYNIIPHLKKHNLLNIIDKLFIEWHYKKIKNIDLNLHNLCKSLISNIEEHYWDALPYSIKNIDKEYQLFISSL